MTSTHDATDAETQAEGEPRGAPPGARDLDPHVGLIATPVRQLLRREPAATLVRRGDAAPRSQPVRDLRQLAGQHGRLQRVQSRIRAHHLVVVDAMSAVHPDPAQSIRELNRESIQSRNTDADQEARGLTGAGGLGRVLAGEALDLGMRVTVVDRSIPRLRQLEAQFSGRIETRASTRFDIAR